MLMKLIVVLISVLCSTVSGFGQSKVNITSKIPSAIGICGASQKVEIDVRNITTGSVSAISVTLTLPTGMHYEKGSVSESFQSVIRTAKKEVHGHNLIPDTLFKNHNCIKSLNQTQLNDLIAHFKETIGENLISDLIIFEIHS